LFLASAILFAGGAVAEEIQVELRDVNNALIRGTVYLYSAKERETPFELETGTGTIRCSDPESAIEADAGPLHFLLAGQYRKPCAGPRLVFVFQIRRLRDPRDRSSNTAPRVDRTTRP
jgi:hypothetical protein